MRKVPKMMVLMSSTSLRSVPGLRDARNTDPQIAPRPIKLLIYPKVAASPLKMTLARPKWGATFWRRIIF